MGGGGEHHGDDTHGHAGADFRTKVWTMSGGPNCRLLHWKRNTAIAMDGIFLVCIPIAMKSAELERFFAPVLSAQFTVAATGRPSDIRNLFPADPPRPRFDIVVENV